MGGVRQALHQQELKSTPIAQRMSPIFDQFVRAKARQTAADAQRFGLIRKTFDTDAWIDNSYLNVVLKEEKLEDFWPRHDSKGVLIDGGTSYAAAFKSDPTLLLAAPIRKASR